MADLKTKFCGIKIKNPIVVTSCDFGETERLAKRVIEQGVGALVSKTIHKIDGPHRWPRPYFYSLKPFGSDLKDSWICSQMFSSINYDEWMGNEGPKIVKLCKENNVAFIGSVCGIGLDLKSWVDLCKDMERLGVDMIELDTGGPHATFGAIKTHRDVGAPLALDTAKAGVITKACIDAVKIPIMFKMTPQCVNMAEMALVVSKAGVAAISAHNALYGAWIDHETGTFYGGSYSCGGLIGRGWQLFSLAKVLEITATVNTPVCGIGGIFNSDDVIRYLMAGCQVAGICSVIYSRGVEIIKKIIKDLNDFMDRKEYKNIDEIKGKVVRDFAYLRDWPREKIMSEYSPVIAKINKSKCTNCGICAKLCAYSAIKMISNKPKIFDDYCRGCGWCVGHCPAQAIIIYEKKSNKLIWNGRGLPVKWAKKL